MLQRLFRGNLCHLTMASQAFLKASGDEKAFLGHALMDPLEMQLWGALSHGQDALILEPALF